VLTVKAREPKQGKSHEIPTPEVWVVPSYETDYRPVFRPPTTYLRGARASREASARARSRGSRARAHVAAGFKRDTELVEYDLDNEDEDWLTTFNGAQNRLPAEKCAPAAGLP
jgi:enhancer of polycomb-like protein